jgi:hypothetical protein
LKKAYANRSPRHKRTPSERRDRQANCSVSGKEIQLPLDREVLFVVMQNSLGFTQVMGTKRIDDAVGHKFRT